MLKQKYALWIPLALALSFVFSLTACGKKVTRSPLPKPPTANTAPTTAPVPVPSLNSGNSGNGSMPSPDSEKFAPPAGPNELVGTWTSSCAAVDERYVQEVITVSVEGKAEKSTLDFFEETCETFIQKETKKGSLAYGAFVNVAENIKTLDLNLESQYGVIQSIRTIYQLNHGILCLGDTLSAHTPDNRPSQISCAKPFTRL